MVEDFGKGDSKVFWTWLILPIYFLPIFFIRDCRTQGCRSFSTFYVNFPLNIQGSIVYLFLFSIFVNDFSLRLKNLCSSNYVDDTLLYNLEIIWKTSKTIHDTTLRMLQNDFKKLILCSIQENAPAGIYLLKVNGSTRTRCEICSKLTIRPPERRHVNFNIFHTLF